MAEAHTSGFDRPKEAYGSKVRTQHRDYLFVWKKWIELMGFLGSQNTHDVWCNLSMRRVKLTCM